MKSAEIQGEDNTNETVFLEGIPHMFLFINFVVSNFCARSLVISDFLHYRTIKAEFSRKVKCIKKIDFMN